MARIIAEEAAELIGADNLRVWLARPDRSGVERRLGLAAAVGTMTSTADPLVERVFRSGQTGEAMRRRKGGCDTRLAIPLMSGQRPLGVIEASIRQEHRAGDDAVRILTMLGDNLTVALEHAHSDTPG